MFRVNGFRLRFGLCVSTKASMRHTCKPLTRIVFPWGAGGGEQTIFLSNLHLSRLRIFLWITLDLWVSNLNVDGSKFKKNKFKFDINTEFGIFISFFFFSVIDAFKYSRGWEGKGRSFPECVSLPSVRLVIPNSSAFSWNSEWLVVREQIGARHRIRILLTRAWCPCVEYSAH